MSPLTLLINWCILLSAPQRAARVKLDDLDLDMVSIDEKWDRTDKQEADSSSRASSPSLSPGALPVIAPSRPLSAPPSEGSIVHESVADIARSQSFDHPRVLDTHV